MPPAIEAEHAGTKIRDAAEEVDDIIHTARRMVVELGQLAAKAADLMGEAVQPAADLETAAEKTRALHPILRGSNNLDAIELPILAEHMEAAVDGEGHQLPIKDQVKRTEGMLQDFQRSLVVPRQLAEKLSVTNLETFRRAEEARRIGAKFPGEVEHFNRST